MGKGRPRGPVHELFFMFDRPCAGHPWQGTFAEIDSWDRDSTSRLTVQAVGANWRLDHRVTEAREGGLLGHPQFLDRAGPDDWLQRVRDYFRAALCRPAEPPAGLRRSAYRDASNDANRIPAHTIAGHDRLIHVGSVTAMLWRLGDARTAAHELVKAEFTRDFQLAFPSAPDGDWEAFKRSVAGAGLEIAKRGPEAVKDLARFLVEALGDSQPPWWASFAAEADEWLEDGEWMELAKVLGLGHLEAGSTIIVWRYKAEEAGPLYRPTVIEANDSPWHFPSPPSRSTGITMPLGRGPRGGLREVIHAPLGPSAARAFCTGDLAVLAEAPISDHSALVELRNCHRQVLNRRFRGDLDSAWLRRASNRWP